MKRSLKITLGAGLALLLLSAFVLLGRGKLSDATEEKEADSLEIAMVEVPPLSPPLLDFIEFMNNELDSSRTVGAAYTLVSGGHVVHTETFGERSFGSGEPVDEHTLFRLASVSKGFAGVLAGLLEEDSVFSLDDPVVSHYEAFRLKDQSSTDSLTIRNIMSHTSGLVPYAYDNLVEAGKSLEEIVARLDEVNVSAAPGELYGYQNVVFSILDPIARECTGESYPELLDEYIFSPLGMEDASAGPPPDAKANNMASPHVRARGGWVALRPHTGYYNVLPAAGVNASISDMGSWLVALLGYRPGVLSDSVLAEIATPLVYTPLKWRYTRYWQPFRERYYSMGWRVYHYRGREIIYHGGYIRGYRAEIAFCPSEDVGIAFMMNSPNSLASRCVPSFLDRVLDYEPPVLDSITPHPGLCVMP